MIKFVFGIVIGVLVIVFAVMNTEVVEVQLYFWTVSMSRALMVLIVLGIGMVIGRILGGLGRRHRSAPRK